MTLTPEQKQAVAAWVGAGDSLHVIQKKLSEQFKVSLTYMDVRFLVDDLNLELQDAKPKADASDVSKAPPPPAQEKKGFLDKTKEKLGIGQDEGEPEDAPGAVRVSVDKVNLNPNALATGSVTFPDGVTAKWMVDHQGRPGLVEVSKPGYRPTQADAQAFMQELALALQNL